MTGTMALPGSSTEVTAATVAPGPARPRPVAVTHEWGVLEEAVVGRTADFVVPADLAHGFPPELTHLPEPLRAALRRWAGRRWSEADPGHYAAAVEQLDALARFLGRRGVTVHRPRELTPHEIHAYPEGGPDPAGEDGADRFVSQTYVRDPMVVVGDQVIEAAMRLPNRFPERFGLRPVFELAAARGARWTVMPPPSPVPFGELSRARGPFLEGGDVMLFGRDVLVGCGASSDEAGARWLAGLLGDGHRVHPVPLAAEAIHLDVGITAVREGLAVVCREVFPHGLPAVLDGWDLVEVGLKEAVELLAGNSLVLGPGEALVDDRLTRLAEDLTARDVTVHTLPYDAVSLFAGGLRCSHHPLVRALPGGR
ncbi:amidinotransferase [Streptomyces abyssomicinicus]|uniref:amidinotransferase n=1 Tax=Streptomyces abyssomicinicus TaxID=574929 RepID=UPI001FE726E0|nr:amidinotransferase [Streptomyces abyssomicinicus]